MDMGTLWLGGMATELMFQKLCTFNFSLQNSQDKIRFISRRACLFNRTGRNFLSSLHKIKWHYAETMKR